VVRDYLVNTWNVPRSRITVLRSPGPISRSGESTEDGREENRRVEFSSNTGTLLGPIASERIVREYTPPAIDIVPDIHAEAGVRRWSITISQANTIVAQYASDDSVSITTGRTADRTWNIADDQIDSVPSPIRVELRVEDSTGAVVTAYDELPITMERRVRVVERQGEEDAEKITYRLVAFDYNSSEPAAGHISTLKEIATEIDSSTHVSVVGYTDRIGGEGFNVELSKRRAERVSELLQEQLQRRGIRTIPIVSTGAGIDAERFGNDTPQGRILSRGVLIMVVHDK
jgi:outer membrane protein OmpA-like peptidoglycan-associated protein